MKEKQLIKKVENYLKESNTIYDKNSIDYIGIREDYIISDEEPKDYYFLSYEVVNDKSNKYSTISYFVYINKKLEKIAFIIGPQSLEKVDLESY